MWFIINLNFFSCLFCFLLFVSHCLISTIYVLYHSLYLSLSLSLSLSLPLSLSLSLFHSISFSLSLSLSLFPSSLPLSLPLSLSLSYTPSLFHSLFPLNLSLTPSSGSSPERDSFDFIHLYTSFSLSHYLFLIFLQPLKRRKLLRRTYDLQWKIIITFGLTNWSEYIRYSLQYLLLFFFFFMFFIRTFSIQFLNNFLEHLPYSQISSISYLILWFPMYPFFLKGWFRNSIR